MGVREGFPVKWHLSWVLTMVLTKLRQKGRQPRQQQNQGQGESWWEENHCSILRTKDRWAWRNERIRKPWDYFKIGVWVGEGMSGGWTWSYYHSEIILAAVRKQDCKESKWTGKYIQLWPRKVVTVSWIKWWIWRWSDKTGNTWWWTGHEGLGEGRVMDAFQISSFYKWKDDAITYSDRTHWNKPRWAWRYLTGYVPSCLQHD